LFSVFIHLILEFVLASGNELDIELLGDGRGQHAAETSRPAPKNLEEMRNALQRENSNSRKLYLATNAQKRHGCSTVESILEDGRVVDKDEFEEVRSLLDGSFLVAFTLKRLKYNKNYVFLKAKGPVVVFIIPENTRSFQSWILYCLTWEKKKLI